jgi:hypothetical protein
MLAPLSDHHADERVDLHAAAAAAIDHHRRANRRGAFGPGKLLVDRAGIQRDALRTGNGNHLVHHVNE